MKITMIGHSTILIEANGKKLLTDPYFGTWGNPAFARCGQPARTRQELRDVDGILISHAHWDHIDGKYLRMLGETPVTTPKLTSGLVKLMGGKNVIGMKAGEVKEFGDITITAVPAVHLTETIGYVLKCEEKHIYFAGDTYYSGFMKEIGREYKIDVALMPVMTYRIPMTMDEKQAVKAVEAIRPSVVIPIHLGIIPRSSFLRTGQTAEHFVQRIKEAGASTKVVLLQIGESFTLD
jgi:L-ascorbate metabolism protein UlaG (beta-lactamase superfamily)